MNKPLFMTISEQIADNIRKSIIFGDLKEGTALREIELSKQYNVSRGPVRDALKELAKEGFLDMIPNVGVRVAKPPSDETLELVKTLRKEIETFVLQDVYDQFSDNDHKEIEKLLHTYKYACETENIHDVIAMDLEFHRYLISKTDDLHVKDLWQSTVNRMMFKYGRFTDLMESYDEHVRIYEAIKNQDKNLLVSLIAQNIV